MKLKLATATLTGWMLTALLTDRNVKAWLASAPPMFSMMMAPRVSRSGSSSTCSACSSVMLSSDMAVFFPFFLIRVAPSWTARQTDFKTNFKVAFQFRESYYAPVVKAVNRSVALTSQCDGCDAVAIGLQIVLISKQDLVAIHALNVASATNDECVGSCDALALAYQIVVASDSPWLTFRQYIALRHVWQEFESLPNSNLTIDQAQSQSEQLVQTVMSILEGSSSSSPADTAPVPSATTPSASTLNGPALPSELVNSNRPIVDLYRDLQWRPWPHH